MNYDPDKIYQKVVELGEEWADKQDAADLLDREEKNVLARLKLTFTFEKSDTAKEMMARCTDGWKQYGYDLVKAKTAARKAKVKYDAARSWEDGMRTKAANLRAEMKL